MKTFNIMGVHRKNQIFKGRVHKKPIYRGELPKKGGGWTVCRFKGEGGAWRKRGMMFLKGEGGGRLIPQRTLCIGDFVLPLH